jgi:hypothetical protein
MSEYNSHRPFYRRPTSRRFILFTAVAAAVLLLGGFVVLRWIVPGTAASAAPAPRPIAGEILEQQYGLRVSLLGVTAAGGMVDLRLKVLDPQKAALLLHDPASLPVLSVGNGNTLLKAQEDTRIDNLKLETGVIFLLYPNLGNLVRPGTPVSIRFGDIRLEPFAAQ